MCVCVCVCVSVCVRVCVCVCVCVCAFVIGWMDGCGRGLLVDHDDLPRLVLRHGSSSSECVCVCVSYLAKLVLGVHEDEPPLRRHLLPVGKQVLRVLGAKLSCVRVCVCLSVCVFYECLNVCVRACLHVHVMCTLCAGVPLAHHTHTHLPVLLGHAARRDDLLRRDELVVGVVL